MTAIGVDGCKAGWVAIRLADRAQASVHATLEEVLTQAPADAAIAVDIPLGLVATGWRASDLAVRTYLVGRRSSLFLIPPRSVVAETDYAKACELAESLTGQRISRQAFALFPKIREVDRHLGDKRVIEVHPETSFAVMAGRPLEHSKKSWAGVALRRELLERHGVVLPVRFDNAADDVGVDDVLDAAVAAWSAQRWLRGEAQSFPTSGGDADASGRQIRIVA